MYVIVTNDGKLAQEKFAVGRKKQGKHREFENTTVLRIVGVLILCQKSANFLQSFNM